MVTINGEEKNVAGKTIYAYLSASSYKTKYFDLVTFLDQGIFELILGNDL